jgi:hypothetical protein
MIMGYLKTIDKWYWVDKQLRERWKSAFNARSLAKTQKERDYFDMKVKIYIDVLRVMDEADTNFGGADDSKGKRVDVSSRWS